MKFGIGVGYKRSSKHKFHENRLGDDHTYPQDLSSTFFTDLEETWHG
jgi:hypothetical protein